MANAPFPIQPALTAIAVRYRNRRLIAELNAPRCQITRIQRRESEGVEMLDLSLVVLPNTGNDEVTLTIR